MCMWHAGAGQPSRRATVLFHNLGPILGRLGLCCRDGVASPLLRQALQPKRKGLEPRRCQVLPAPVPSDGLSADEEPDDAAPDTGAPWVGRRPLREVRRGPATLSFRVLPGGEARLIAGEAEPGDSSADRQTLEQSFVPETEEELRRRRTKLAKPAAEAREAWLRRASLEGGLRRGPRSYGRIRFCRRGCKVRPSPLRALPRPSGPGGWPG